MTRNAVRSKDVQLDAARQLVAVVDELFAIADGTLDRGWGGYVRSLKEIALEALDEPSRLDDEEGRADFASALRESMPWGTGFGGWDDWNAPPPHAGRSYELKERLADLVYST